MRDAPTSRFALDPAARRCGTAFKWVSNTLGNESWRFKNPA